VPVRPARRCRQQSVKTVLLVARNAWQEILHHTGGERHLAWACLLLLSALEHCCGLLICQVANGRRCGTTFLGSPTAQWVGILALHFFSLFYAKAEPLFYQHDFVPANLCWEFNETFWLRHSYKCRKMSQIEKLQGSSEIRVRRKL
jgi:hypothetical protein